MGILNFIASIIPTPELSELYRDLRVGGGGPPDEGKLRPFLDPCIGQVRIVKDAIQWISSETREKDASCTSLSCILLSPKMRGLFHKKF